MTEGSNAINAQQALSEMLVAVAVPTTPGGVYIALSWYASLRLHSGSAIVAFHDSVQPSLLSNDHSTCCRALEPDSLGQIVGVVRLVRDG